MKLKCVTHNKRVMVLNMNKSIHRSDGSVCNSELQIGSFRGYAVDVPIEMYIRSTK